MSEFVNAGNNFRIRLSSSMSENDTDLPFDILTFEGTAPEDYPFLLTINSGKSNMEIVKVIGLGSDMFTYEVERGQEGTTAQSHEAGSIVENNFTAGTYQALVDEVDKVVIEEMQNNGNNGYIKYKNGTLECWTRLELGKEANARMGGFWLFPKEFTNKPNVTFSIDYTESNITPSVFELSALYVRNISENEVEFAVGRMTGSDNFGDNDIMHVFAKAIGRWK